MDSCFHFYFIIVILFSKRITCQITETTNIKCTDFRLACCLLKVNCSLKNVLLFSYERQESVTTTEARLRMEGVEFKEEWQDEDFPR